MLHDIIRKALSVQCSKTARLCLISMAAYLHKPLWTVPEFSNLLGAEAKSIRLAMKELIALKLVKQAGIAENSAHLFILDFELLMAFESANPEQSSQSDLASLERRAQRHHSLDKRKSKPSKAS